MPAGMTPMIVKGRRSSSIVRPSTSCVASELSLPELDDEDDLVTARSATRLLVLAGEGAAEDRLHSEHVEEFTRSRFCTMRTLAAPSPLVRASLAIADKWRCPQKCGSGCGNRNNPDTRASRAPCGCLVARVRHAHRESCSGSETAAA